MSPPAAQSGLNCQTRATRTGMSPPAAQSGLNCQTRATRTGMSPPAGASPGDRHQPGGPAPPGTATDPVPLPPPEPAIDQGPCAHPARGPSPTRSPRTARAGHRPGRPRAAREPPPSRTPPPLIEGASGDASDPRWPTRQTAPRARATARNPPPAYTNRQSPRAHGALSRYPIRASERRGAPAKRPCAPTPSARPRFTTPHAHACADEPPSASARSSRRNGPWRRVRARAQAIRAERPDTPRETAKRTNTLQPARRSRPPTPTHAQTSPRPRAGGLPGETAAG
jgi:hypothetical protein